MKRIYPLMILTAALLVFTGCNDSSTSGGTGTADADSGMTAAASGTSIAVMTAVGNAMSDMGGVSQGSGSREMETFM